MASDNKGLVIPEGKLVLITTDDWFNHKDSGQYKGVIGKPEVIKPEDLIGFHPKGSTDWMLHFTSYRGDELFVAGCRVHYVAIVDKGQVAHKDVLDLR